MTLPELRSGESFTPGRASLWLTVLVLAAPAANAEPVYVIEQLVVSLASAPGPEGERIGQVKSGDRLELLEREGDEAHVRLPSGTEGWIKASYLSAEEPLQHRLTERTAELEKLKQEGDQLKQDMSRLESQLAAARATHNVAPAPTATPTPTPTPTPAPAGTPGPNTPPTETIPPPVSDALSGGSTPIRETVFLRSPERSGQTPWPLVVGTSFVMLLAGFVLGWKTLDRRIRQKYGGLRIY
jgi:hypothetical protein